MLPSDVACSCGCLHVSVGMPVEHHHFLSFKEIKKGNGQKVYLYFPGQTRAHTWYRTPTCSQPSPNSHGVLEADHDHHGDFNPRTAT